jgi:RNA polymerase sigma factor (sigma-70 family)
VLIKPRRRGRFFVSDLVSKEITDEELIAKICLADHQAFEVLYKRYYQRIFGFAYRIMRSLEDIEEIINDVMFVVWKKAGSFNKEVLVSTWIFGIAYKKCLKALSKISKAQLISLDDDSVGDIPETQVSGLKSLEIEDWLSVIFSKLPVDQRTVLELAYHEGLSYGEIAEIMECPENTVKTRMFHARKKIKLLFPGLADELNSEYYGNSI